MPTKQAWAAYVRRRWPVNCLGYAQAEWDLTAGEARGLVYGQVSQATIDKIDNHKNGGDRVLLAVRAVQAGADLMTWLSDFITSERKRLANELAALDADTARVVEMAGHLRAWPDLGAASAVGTDLRGDREPRSFRRAARLRSHRKADD